MVFITQIIKRNNRKNYYTTQDPLISKGYEIKEGQMKYRAKPTSTKGDRYDNLNLSGLVRNDENKNGVSEG